MNDNVIILLVKQINDDNPAVIGQLASRYLKHLGSGRVQVESQVESKEE